MRINHRRSQSYWDGLGSLRLNKQMSPLVDAFPLPPCARAAKRHIQGRRGVQALTKQARPLHRFLHLVANLRPEQCLRPYPEENGLGFAKVGLGRSPPSPPVDCRTSSSRRPVHPSLAYSGGVVPVTVAGRRSAIG